MDIIGDKKKEPISLKIIRSFFSGFLMKGCFLFGKKRQVISLNVFYHLGVL